MNLESALITKSARDTSKKEVNRKEGFFMRHPVRILLILEKEKER